MNHWIGVGRLTKNPTLTYAGGIPKCTFILASESRVGNYSSTDFIPIVIWREAAENAAQYLVKGQRVGVTGKLRTRTYKKDGVNVNSFEVECYEVNYYDAPKGS